MGMLQGDRVDIAIGTRISKTAFHCQIAPCQADGVLHLPAELAEHAVKCGSATLLDCGIDLLEATVHLTIKRGGDSPSRDRGPYRAAELFGGLGGWSYAASLWMTSVTVIVERDERTAQACAKAKGAEVHTVEEFLELAIQGKITTPVVVRGDIKDTLLWMAMSILNVAYILASPPCQSWSSVGAGTGLASPDGDIFAIMLRRAGYARILALLAENVPGIVRHADYGVLITGGAMDGMRLVTSGTYKCQRTLPVQRDRWLATFIHVSLSVESVIIKQAESFTFASPECKTVLPGPTLTVADTIMQNMDADHRGRLTPDADAMKLLVDPTVLPNRWKVSGDGDDAMLRARTIDGSMQLSGIMAMYGSQHKLPISHLREKGMFTVLYHDQEGYRYFSPHEIVAALGFPECVVLDDDMQMAHQQAGNAISIAHAWLQIAKTHILLGQLSPFTKVKPWDVMVDQLKMDACKMTGKVRQVCDGFAQMVDATVVPRGPGSSHDQSGQAGKRQRVDQVDPTAPFQIDRDLGYTAAFEGVQTFVSHDLAKTTGPQPFAKGGLLFLQHFQANWMSVAHGQQTDVISTMIQRALPHAKKSHFLQLRGPDGEIEWETTVPCVPPVRLIFQPTTFQVSCVLPGERVLMSADVTWTVETVLAYVASAMKCQVPSLILTNGDLPTKTCDFLAEYETQEYKVGFKMTMPGYVSFAMPEQMNCPQTKPADPDDCRFVATHPSMKVVRTAAVKQGQTIGDVVKALFPHLASTTAWGITVNGLPVNGDTGVAEITQFVVDWQCYQPLPPTIVEKCSFAAPVDSATIQIGNESYPNRWVRSPFSTRAQVLKLPDDSTVKQIAASFVAHTNLNITIMCTMGGTVVHPDANLSSIANTDVLMFRVSPLKGGAKQATDQLRNKVVHNLQQHGVGDAAQTRAEAFLAKCDHETLIKAVNTDDITFWDEMKQEANRVKFRLVFRNELTNLRKDARKKPPSKAAKGIAKQPKAFVANPTNIKIDMKHFTDGEQQVELLDPQRFGPDQSGLAIMNCKDADRHCASQGLLSMEALAILVVGRVFHDDDEIFQMPAYDNNGAPIVIQAALRQFGDRHIQFTPAVPNSVVSRSASTAVEIHIYKSEVAKWADCSVPLHYLGVHVSAVRGSSLIAQWAFRTYSASRSPVGFKDSAYWHGYIRVQDDILDAVIARSGWHGIYLSPKNADRRHDERYSIVVMPECTLSDAQKKASTQDKALGIVKVKDQYAVRCRREHAVALRAALLPESAFVAMEAVSSDEQLWLLKNVPIEIGKAGLQQALTLAEWQAHPVRAQGLDRWVVASNALPPCRRLCINSAFVLVEPFKRANENAPVTMVAKQFKVETLVSSTPSGQMQVATTSRYQEMKADLSEQMEQKLSEATNQINMLAQQMQTMQANHNQEITSTRAELAMVRDEQAFANQKLQEVESSVVQSSHSVIKTMQGMFTQMQSTLEQSMKQSIEASMQAFTNDVDENKRARVGDVPRTDVFSTKS
eukprot:Skav201581  [mRNA]  locus=scaffold152:211979:216484:+ [translate_table: standard]